MLDWIKRILGIVDAVLYLFRCALCAVEETLALAEAKRKGWHYQESGKNWRCPKCGN